MEKKKYREVKPGECFLYIAWSNKKMSYLKLHGIKCVNLESMVDTSIMSETEVEMADFRYEKVFNKRR